MGVDTRLIINSKWSLEDIKETVRAHLDVSVEWRATHTPSYNIFVFTHEGEERQMNVHTSYPTPIGPAVLLSLRHNDQAVRIMTVIAKALGGFLQPEDYAATYECFEGILYNDDGLPYFLKHAVIHDELKDNHDFHGLNESIHKWFDGIGGRRTMRLFPRKNKGGEGGHAQ